MKVLRHCLTLLILVFLVKTIAASQLKESRYGIGVSVGATYPMPDIPEPRYEPYARIFLRYFPIDIVGTEMGVGMGTVESKYHSSKFFSSIIIPTDARLLIQPMSEGVVLPYAFGGVGMMYFNPVDRVDMPLPRNTKGVYNRNTVYIPVGVGCQYYIAEQTAVEFSASYNATLTKNLDDIDLGKNDSYWVIALSVFGLLSEGNVDSDGDGLLNAEERQLGTDLNNGDTDGDGLRDGEEVRTYRTNPLIKDSDGDGLTDYDEIFVYRTNPLQRDSDDDGLTDGDEILKFNTNALKSDTDGDGLNDGEEVLNYHTNPLRADTDGDTLGDGDEVIKYRTDPLRADTDGDGLTDAEERLKYRTNPLFADTDEGGVPDGREIAAGTSPLNPKDDVQQVVKIGTPIILEGVTFETGSARITPAAKFVLDKIIPGLIKNPTIEIAIHGHTDNQGKASDNLRLSQERANAVKAYLVSQGVDAARIQTKGFGFTRPIADNATEEGRAKNRRIEFIRIK